MENKIVVENLEVANIENMAELGNDKMKELYARATELTRQFNAKLQGNDLEGAMKLDLDIKSTVGEYTKESRLVCFEWLKNQENPMLTAIKMLDYPTIRVHDTKVGEDVKIPVREITESTKEIDLLDLHKYIGGDGIGADPSWMHYAQKMNQLMTAYACNQLGIDPTEVWDSYDMSQIARKIQMGETPTSNTQLLKVLTEVIQTMIGPDYRPVSKDVAYLKFVYGGKGKRALTLKCANHKAFRRILAEICHRIVCNKAYTVDFKKMKNK